MTFALVRQITRFATVGVFSTAAHAVVLLGMAAIVAPLLANLLGFLCGLFISYFGHHRYSFACEGSHRRHMARFFLVATLGFLVSHMLTYAITILLAKPTIIAALAIVVIVPMVTYMGSHFFAFASDAPKSTADSGIADSERRAWSGEALAAVFALAVAILATMIIENSLLHQDVSWFVISTRMWIEGAVLYEDIVEVNPPMMYYLMRVAYFVTSPLGLSDKSAFLLFLASTALLSCAFVGALLRRTILSSAQRGMFLGAVMLVFFLTPLPLFGQRPQLMMIFVLPYMIWSCLGARGLAFADSAQAERTPAPHRKDTLIGIACALFALPGLLIKPFFFLLPAIAILLRSYRAGDWRVLFALPHWIIAIGALAFIIVVWWFHLPYIERIIPYALIGYGAVREAFSTVYLGILPVIFSVLAVLLAAALYIRETSAWLRSFSGSLVCFTIGGYLIYIIQGNGFPYHLIAMHSFLVLAAVAFLITSPPRDIRLSRFWGIMVIVAAYVPQLLYPTYQNKVVELLAPPLAKQAKVESLYVLSSNMWTSFPLVNEVGLRWTVRSPMQWYLPGVWNKLYGADSEKLSEMERAWLEEAFDYNRRSLVDDLIDNRPDIVMIDERVNKSYFRVAGFDYIEHMRGDPRFAEAWQSYRRVSTAILTLEADDYTMGIYAHEDIADTLDLPDRLGGADGTKKLISESSSSPE